MTQKETPSSRPREEAKKTFTFEQLLERSERIRAVLNISEDPAQWRAFLESLNTLNEPTLQIPEQWKTHIRLNERRQLIVTTLYHLIDEYIDRGIDAPPDITQSLRRNLAQYYVAQSLYHQQIEGIENPRVPLVPKDLGKYVQLGEVEKSALLFADIVLPTQYDVRDSMGIPADISPQSLSLFTNEIVLHAMIHRARMKDMLAYLDAPAGAKSAQMENVRNALGFPSWTARGEYSAKLLLGFLQKHRGALEQYSTSVLGTPLENLTVADALQATLHMSPAGEFIKAITENAGALAQGNLSIVREQVLTALSGVSTYAEAALQTTLAPVAALKENATNEERDEFRKDIREVILFFIINRKSEDGTARYPDTYLGELTIPQRKYADHIINATVGNNEAKERTIRLLERALLLPTSEEERDREERRIGNVIRDVVMNDKVPLRDAFKIYYFSEVSKNGHVPLAFVALQLMKDRAPEQWTTATDAETRLAYEYLGIAWAALWSSDMKEVSNALGFVEGSLETVEFRNFALFMEDRGLGELGKRSYQLYSLVRKFPWLYVGGGAAGGVVGYKGWIWFITRRTAMLAGMSDDELLELAKKDPEKFRMAKLCREEAKTLVTQSKLGLRRFPNLRSATPQAVWEWFAFPKRASVTGNALSKVVHNLETSTLTDILRTLHSHHPNIHILMGFGEQQLGEKLPAIRKALQEIGFKPQEIAAAVKTRGIERFTVRAKDIMDDIKRMEGLVDDPAKRRRALALIEEAADSFRDEFNAFDTEFPGARKTLAKSLAEPGTELSEAFLEAVEKAHVQKRLSQKVGIFFDAPITNEERKLAGRFIRLGLAGESEVLKVPRTIDELRAAVKGAANSNEALSLVRRFAHSADAIDPDAYRALLQEADIRKIVGATEAAKVERAAALSAKQLRNAKIWKGVGIISGVGLEIFGVLVDGYLIYETNKEIVEAKKHGDTAQVELLRSKWGSLAGEAGFGVVSGGLGMAGLLTGLPAVVAFGGLMAKSYSSDKLYDYAEDLNKTELKEFLKKSPEELMGLLYGQGDWPLLDNKVTEEYRYGLAVDAYMLKTHTLAITPLDERYMKEVIFELPAWQEKNPYAPETIAAAEKVILEEKAAKYKIHVAEFLGKTGGLASPSPRRVELATAYATLKYLERRADDLGDPTILHDTLYKNDGFIPAKGIATVEPGDLLDDVKEHRIARALDQEKAGSLFHKVSMLKTLVEEGEMPKEVARVEFLNEFSASLLAHDGTLFLKDMAGKSGAERFRHDQTLVQILYYEVGPLFDKAIDNSEAFAKEALALRNSIRLFLAEGKPFTLEELQEVGTSFGPRVPTWYGRNALKIPRT